MSAKRWILREQDAERVDSLAGALGVSPTLAALLISRGCDDEAAATDSSSHLQINFTIHT